MHTETYNCIGEENKKKFYAKLKELEDDVTNNPGHWGPEIALEWFRRYGEVDVLDAEDEIQILKESDDLSMYEPIVFSDEFKDKYKT